MCSGWSSLCPRTPSMKAVTLTRPMSTLYSGSQWAWSMGLPKPWLSQSSRSEVQNLWSKDGHVPLLGQPGSKQPQELLAVILQQGKPPRDGKQRHENMRSLGAFWAADSCLHWRCISVPWHCMGHLWVSPPRKWISKKSLFFFGTHFLIYKMNNFTRWPLRWFWWHSRWTSSSRMFFYN